MVYITISEFQTFTRQTFDTESEPTSTEVQQYIDWAEAEVDRFSGRSWGTATHIETKFYVGQRFALNNTPVSSVTSVQDLEGEDLEYTLLGDMIELKSSASQKKVTIVYEGGHTQIPIEVKKLTYLYALNSIIQAGSSQASSTESISIGALTIVEKIGANSVLNMDRDIAKYEKAIQQLMFYQ